MSVPPLQSQGLWSFLAWSSEQWDPQSAQCCKRGTKGKSRMTTEWQTIFWGSLYTYGLPRQRSRKPLWVNQCQKTEGFKHFQKGRERGDPAARGHRVSSLPIVWAEAGRKRWRLSQVSWTSILCGAGMKRALPWAPIRGNSLMPCSTEWWQPVDKRRQTKGLWEILKSPLP